MRVVVDSHQHFWDPRELDLPPLPPEAAVLGRAYLPEDLRPEIKRVGVTHTVYVQGYPQTLATNKWMFRHANATDFVAGVVAWMNLEDPSAAPSVLEELKKERKFVGIRHIVEEEPDVNWIMRDSVLESLRVLVQFGVQFDMLAKPRHLPNVLTVLDQVPDLHMVVDHIAKPKIAKGGSPGWAEQLAATAQNPNVYCKLSGMITEADWHRWKPSDFKPYVERVIEVFGWNRVMFGSDWPVCLLAGTYQQVWAAINEVLEGITVEQRNKVFAENAIRFYGLKV